MNAKDKDKDKFSSDFMRHVSICAFLQAGDASQSIQNVHAKFNHILA
jgi:hypothetical protein